MPDAAPVQRRGLSAGDQIHTSAVSQHILLAGTISWRNYNKAQVKDVSHSRARLDVGRLFPLFWVAGHRARPGYLRFFNPDWRRV